MRIAYSKQLYLILPLLTFAWGVESQAASGSNPSESARHWAFIPPERPDLPKVEQTGWVRNPIDRFILARLEEREMQPSRQADPVTLLRRLSLDLRGLPPTPEEVDAFLQNPTDQTYEVFVERYLASPHYGERWGRHWLDLARYADSNGYSIDGPRSIWPYRDWVIEAFNDDMPFDEFTIKQLAGDLLPDATLQDRVATGFHRNTQINQEGGIDKEQYRVESIVDRVSTTGTVWLGLTVACAQCHNHKFDPIKQEEFYEMFAFFNSDDEPNMDVASESELAERDRIQKEIDRLEQRLKKEVEKGDPEYQELEGEIARLRSELPRIPTTMVLRRREEPRTTHLHIKGDFTRKGKVVQPGVPDVLHALPQNPSAGELRTRYDLAQWMVDPSNPLTSRVTVNRIWQRYFGKGLVPTENDFGTEGVEPSHPELLDWLATEFLRQGWSMKAMHRLIVNSATYRQSSDAASAVMEKDPANKWLERQNRLRLEAEIVRDVGLAASGLLIPEIGGPSVHPPQPEGVMKLGQVQRSWKADTDEDRYRRGMYTFFWRATPHPSLKVFDAPDANSACTRRIRSNTPLQALTLLNDEAYFEMAQGLARRVVQAEPDDRTRLNRAFRLCLARAPDQEELGRLHELLEQQRGSLKENPKDVRALVGETPLKGVPAWEQAAWTVVARVLLNLDETITRE